MSWSVRRVNSAVGSMGRCYAAHRFFGWVGSGGFASGFELDLEAGEEELDDGPDEDRECDGSDPERATQEPSDHQHRHLEDGAGEADRGSELGDSRHQTVAEIGR